MTDPRSLVEQLTRIRQSRGLTQAAIARRMGVNRSAITRLETDPARDPKLSTLTRYAHALKLQITLEEQ